VVKRWLPDAAVKEFGCFGAIAHPWRLGGMNVIPLSPQTKTPLHPFGPRDGRKYRAGQSPPPREGWNRADSPAIPDDVYDDWYVRFPAANAAAIPGFAGLVVFDVDDASMRDALVDHLGLTGKPLLETRTSRGCHIFVGWDGDSLGMGAKTYTLPGMDEAPIDHRQFGGYVALAGSIHQSGIEYTCNVPWDDLVAAAQSPGGLRQLTSTLDPARELAARRRRRVTVPGTREPREYNGPGVGPFEHRGYVHPTTEVVAEDGRTYTLREIEPGLGFYAWDREDKNPSMRVSEKDGKRWVFDWGSRHAKWLVHSPLDVSRFFDPSKNQIGEDQTDKSKQCDRRSRPTRTNIIEKNSPSVGQGESNRAANDAGFTHSAGARLPDFVDFMGPPARFSRDYATTVVPETERYVGPTVERTESHDSADTIFMNPQPGAGKTEAAVALFKRHAHLGPSVVLGPRRAICRANAARFGIKAYTETSLAVGDHVASTIHSAVTSLDATTGGEYERIGVLILDEFQKTLEDLANPRGVIKDPCNVTAHLRAAVYHAKVVVALDADLSARAVAMVLSWRRQGCKARLYVHDRKRDEKPTLTSNEHAEVAIEDHFEMASQDPDHRFVVAVDSVRRAEGMRDKYQTLYPNVPVMLISGENSDEPEVQAALEDVDANIMATHQVLIHTSAIDSGVSITTPVAASITSIENPDLGPEHALQMGMRARNAGTRIFATKRYKPRVHAATARLLADQHELGLNNDKTVLMAHLKGRQSKAVSRGYTIDNPDYEALFWSEQAAREQRMLDRCGAFRALLASRYQAYDDTLDVDPDDDDAQLAKDARRRTRAFSKLATVKHCDEVAKAEEISDKEAERIDRAHTKTSEEKQKLALHRIKTFYGGEDADIEVTPQLVKRDDRGKLPPKLRMLAKLTGMLDGRTEDVGAICFVRHRGKTRARQSAEFLTLGILAELLRRVLGIRNTEDFANITCKVFEGETLARSIFAFVEEHRDALTCLRWFGTIPKAADRCVRWFGGLMRKLGIEKDHDAAGQSGVGGRTYGWLVADALSLAGPCIARTFGAQLAKAQTTIQEIEFSAMAENWMNKAA